MNQKLIALRVPEALIRDLDEISKDKDMTRSGLIRTLAKSYIEKWRGKGEERGFWGCLRGWMRRVNWRS